MVSKVDCISLLAGIIAKDRKVHRVVLQRKYLHCTGIIFSSINATNLRRLFKIGISSKLEEGFPNFQILHYLENFQPNKRSFFDFSKNGTHEICATLLQGSYDPKLLCKN